MYSDWAEHTHAVSGAVPAKRRPRLPGGGAAGVATPAPGSAEAAAAAAARTCDWPAR